MPIKQLKEAFRFPQEKPAVEARNLGFNNAKNVQLFKHVAESKPRVIVELGSYLGQSALFWLELNPEAIVICIDHWGGLSGWVPDTLPKDLQEDNFPLFETFLVNLWDHRDRVIPIQADTTLGLSTLDSYGVSPDVIYLDADHEYASVREEIRLCRKFFPGATLCGDDFDDPNFPGVVKAVLDSALPNLMSNGRCWLSAPMPAPQLMQIPQPPDVSPCERKPAHASKTAKKIIWTLDIDNYAPEIKRLTRPLLEVYAHKIGANIHDITERHFPGWPTTYNKLAIWELAKQYSADWHLYIDSDVLVYPDQYDITEFLPADTVAHNGHDFTGTRWKSDDYFRRDGRNISSANWLAVASRMCLDLWHPIDDLTPEQALANIFPTAKELSYRNADGSPRCSAEHLIDDYALSRNIARFGLKFTTIVEMNQKLGLGNSAYFFHNYTWSNEEKVAGLRKVLEEWNIPPSPVADTQRKTVAV